MALGTAFAGTPAMLLERLEGYRSLGIDPVGLAQVKTAAQFHRMMMAEASMLAYQDIFMLSGLISLLNIVPALLRQRQQQAEVTTASTPPTLTSKPIQQDSSAR